MIKNYLKIAFRSFWRHKVFTLINVIGLSVGISASLVIYLIVQHDLTFDKFHKDGDRIYRVVTNFTFSGEPAYNPGVCGPLPWAVKNQVPGLQVSAPVFRLLLPDVFIPKGQSTPTKYKQQQNIAIVDGDYFKLIDYKWLAGSPRTALNEPNKVVLTSGQAERYFPGMPYDQVMGKTVIYDTIKTTVSGIVATLTENSDFTFHDFISYPTAFASSELKSQLNLHNWGSTNVRRQLFVRLAPASTTAGMEKQLNEILSKNRQAQKGKTQAFALQPLSDIHFNPLYGAIASYDTASKTTLYCLLGIALFLLLLGCINFVNLATAQATHRAKEIGVRKTMGSSRGQLIWQFLTETWLTTMFAVFIAALLTPFILRLFSGFISEGVTFNPITHPGILMFLLLLSILVSVLSGFYPAAILSGVKPVAVLKSQVTSGQTRNAWMRKSLIVTQFVIAQFFIMATVMVGKQIYYAVNKDLGFKKQGILTIPSPFRNGNASSNQVLLNKLRTIPQVDMVSLGNDEPSSENTSSTEATYRDGKKEIHTDNLSEKFGDENYIKLYHIKLLAGRNLQPGDTNKAFLINATYARLIGFQNPNDAVGKIIDNFNGDTRMRVVGVVSDFHQESLHAPVAPLVIMTSANEDDKSIFHVALKPQSAGSNDWGSAISSMQRSWKQVYKNDDFEYHFVDENVAHLYDSEQRTATLLEWATGLSILISCLGLLGLAIYTTTQRTKEIGVRKVLGATVTQIVALLSRELVLLILLAFVIVTPFAWLAINKWMQGFADKTSISWWVFGASGAVMLLAAMFTSAFQTVKAAIANPAQSLKSE